jgi:hypothetical protein
VFGDAWNRKLAPAISGMTGKITSSGGLLFRK